MIELENVSKRYGERLAVDGLTFTVQPGIVTVFFGPMVPASPPRCG